MHKKPKASSGVVDLDGESAVHQRNLLCVDLPTCEPFHRRVRLEYICAYCHLALSTLFPFCRPPLVVSLR